MTDGGGDASQTDPRWPKLVSLSAHELRTPLSVVSGYLRMVLQGHGGPLADPQRRLLTEAEKSCGRLKQVLDQMSELSQHEQQEVRFNRTDVDLQTIIRDAAATLPEPPSGPVTMAVTGDAPTVHGDAVRLRTAFAAVLWALQRELVTGNQLTAHIRARGGDQRIARIVIAAPDRLDALTPLPPAELAVFDEWRGGNGLALPNARRILNAHGGHIWDAPPGGAELKAAAVVELPSQ